MNSGMESESEANFIHRRKHRKYVNFNAHVNVTNYHNNNNKCSTFYLSDIDLGLVHLRKVKNIHLMN